MRHKEDIALRTKLFGVFAILLISTAVAGCKLEVVAVQGGDVSWSDGTCLEGNNCVIEITDPNFSDNFSVTPKPGYEFVKWQSGDGFLCGEETGSCAFTMPADADQAAAVIALFRTGYMMPVYEDVGFDTDEDGQFDRIDEDDDNDGVLDVDDQCPLVGPAEELGCPGRQPSNTVSVGGKLWAQPNEFPLLSFEELEAACPGGKCSGQLVSNSNFDSWRNINLTGWRWASPEEVRELFSELFASCEPSSTGNYSGNCDVVSLASSAGFEGLDIGVPDRDGDIKGWVSQSGPPNGVYCSGKRTAYTGVIQVTAPPFGEPGASVGVANIPFCVDDSFVDYGAWLYRVPLAGE